MSRRVVLVAWCSVLSCALVSCNATPSKTAARNSTIATTRATAGAAPSTTPAVPAVAASTAPAAAADQGLSPSSVAAPTSAAATPTTAAGRVVSSPSDSVGLGDSGSGVKQIQTALNAHGYKVTVDGSFGPKTEQAVKGFQAARGLKQDGVVGNATWAKLKAAPATTATKSTTTTVKATTTTNH
jgi:peptidoglycan hydrolase-like protein with peptidoglycan-binding domain